MDHKDPTTVFEQMDVFWQAALARYTLGTCPADTANSYAALINAMLISPGKFLQNALYPLLRTKEFIATLQEDHNSYGGTDQRFKSESWDLWPWRYFLELFLFCEKWGLQSVKGVPGLDDHAERLTSFIAKQCMDALCPANFIVTNPDLTYLTFKEGGGNIYNGALNAANDTAALLLNRPSRDKRFQCGKNLAVTPGDVVFKNELIELIRYKPSTETVAREPILIFPAWIMKYYILDLSPHNSLVNFLVAQGHTVFMVSWRNPGEYERNLGMDDYCRLGAFAALDEVSRAFPDTKIHLTGYCLGGTLAIIAAAALAQNKDRRIKTLTLLASQADFTEAGELMTFISKSTVNFLKNMMRVQGYLDPKQMAGAFQMLRPYDLIWSKVINDYLEGRRKDTFDLTAWNADTTRLPYKMHSEYLERLFLNNEFAQGRFTVEGKAVSPHDVTTPVFCVATEKDHVVPWHSAYKTHFLTGGEVTFVLTSGGHNAGIVSEPGHPDRHFYLRTQKRGQTFLSPASWRKQASHNDGSWWPAWSQWLKSHSTQLHSDPSPVTHSLGQAPGEYVFGK